MAKKKRKNKYPSKRYSIEQFVPDDELDFHIFGVINHFDVEKILNEFLEDSEIADNKNLLIIVGKGNVVRPQVRKLLSRHKSVEKFKQAGYFNGQDGAFEVILSA